MAYLPLSNNNVCNNGAQQTFHYITDNIQRPILVSFIFSQKLFLDNLRKALGGQGGSKQLMESAAIACVKLCKASTYINWEDHSVIFLLVQSIVMDLQVSFNTVTW